MRRLLLALAVSSALSAQAQQEQAPDTLGAIVWVKLLPAMERMTYSLVDDIELVDRECRSNDYMPRVCLYRHLSRCRVISKDPPDKLPFQVKYQLQMMCDGWFPEPVLLKRKFSDPAYLPNQAAPSADPEWQFMHSQAISDRRREEDKRLQDALIK